MRSTKGWIRSAGFGFACLLVMLGTLSGAHAQGVGTSGEITGTVTDSSGGIVPKAAVTVIDTQTGLKRTAATNNSGQFRVAGLSPATYDISAEMAGFATEIRKSVTVAVGQIVISDFKLNPSQVRTLIEVTDRPPVVETERTSQADTIPQQYITDLPVDRRDYLTFTLLAPGVSDSTRLAGDQDFRVKQTPQSGLSFYGSNGRGNSITIDGGETSGDSGGVRLTVGQDVVQEFQINRSNYNADLGNATGASINIVTKSGTNNAHGSLFGFFRNDAMDARDPFAFSSALAPDSTYSNFNTTSTGDPIKNALSRQQYGGAIGFPIQKDKTFLFGSFEGLRQNSQNSVPLLTNSDIFAGPSMTATTNPFAPSDPRYAQQAIVTALANNSNSVPCLAGLPNLPGPECAFALQGLLSVSPLSPSNPPNPFVTPGQTALNAFLVSQFENEGGVFPFDSRQYLGSGRLDHRFDVNNELSVTYRYGHDSEQSPDVQSLTALSAGSSTHTYDHNLQASWYHQFSPTAQNEARVQWDYNSFNVIPNEPAQAGLQIPGFINNLGTNIFLPSITILRRYEFADNFTLIRGNHTFKFGGYELVRGNHTESHTFFPGRFVFGSLPGVALSPQLAGASISSLQAAGLGLPQVYQQGFGTPQVGNYNRPLTAFYAQDSWKIASNFTVNYGLRYELDSQYSPLTTYKKDFAPRVSFAWDPRKDHKTVVRGGYGIFYAPIDFVIPDVDLALGVLNKNKSAVENSGSFGGQVANVSTICGQAPLSGGNGTSPCNRPISIYADNINGVPPLGIAGSATIFQTLFAQRLIQCTTPTAGNNACITPAAAAGPFPGAQPVGIDVTNSGPLSPLSVIFVNQPGYRPPIAQQASFGIEQEIGPGFSISLSGIYSHTQRLPVAIDTNALPAPFSTVTLANGSTVSYRNWNTTDPSTHFTADPLGGIEGQPCNTVQCFVNPLIVQNNQYSSQSYALYEGAIVEVKKRFREHFTLFGNYTFSKGYDTSTDYNSDYGPQDPTNLALDRSLSEFNQRHKLLIAGVLDSPWRQSFLSGFQLAPIFTAHSGHPFNLLAGGEVNGDNHITNERPIGAARDTGLGPNYFDFDMRLTWGHKLGEKSNLQFTAEGFNIANRTNYASVNNEVSPLFGFEPGFTTFNVKGIKPGTALVGGGTATSSTPLAFTSALPKRQVQLGLRFTF